MNEISYEEAKKSINELIEENIRLRGGVIKSNHQIAYNFIEQHKPPTFDEVVKAWEAVVIFKRDNEKTRIVVNQRDSKTIDVELDWFGFDGLRFTKDRICIREQHTIIFKPIRKSELFLKEEIDAINQTIRYLQEK